MKTKRLQRESGFSLIEALITLAIIAIVTGIAILSLGNTMRSMHADSGVQTTLQVLRRARQTAIDQRARIWVAFNAPAAGLHTMSISRMVPAGVPIPYAQIPLPSDVQFFADPNFPIPPNTPDSIGNGKTAIDFEDGFAPAPGVDVYFMPDGSAVNVNGNTINGVVYIEQTGYWKGARAVTLFGATGRLRSLRLAARTGGYVWQ
jgi:prepilin-type N-terminal cleavage/methylation domain-containing protein